MKFVLLINIKLLIIANSFLQNITEHEIFSACKDENVFISIDSLVYNLIDNYMLSFVLLEMYQNNGN